jgi:hypothetical protein
LALKKRDAIGTANGEITKLGKKLTEKQLSDIDTLVAKKVENRVIIEKYSMMQFPVQWVSMKKIEFVFSRTIKRIALIEDDTNVVQVFIDYGYPDANKFGVVTPWSIATAKPLDDIHKEQRSQTSVFK